MLKAKPASVCLTVALLNFLPATPLRAQEKQLSLPSLATEYRIQVGDVIKLDVWKEPQISRTVPVDRNGNIQLPLLHNVKAAGLTAMQLAALIREKLLAKISSPQVTVTVTEIRSPPALLFQLLPTMPVHPESSPSPDLRRACCEA